MFFLYKSCCGCLFIPIETLRQFSIMIDKLGQIISFLLSLTLHLMHLVLIVHSSIDIRWYLKDSPYKFTWWTQCALLGIPPQTSSCRIGSLFFLQDILAIYLNRNCLCITVVGRGKTYPLFREACSPKSGDPEAPGDCLEKDLHCQP